MLMVAWRAWRSLREYRWIVGLSATAGVLVLAQAGLGGLTVEEGLHEYLVAAHLGLAMIFLGTLFTLRRLASEPEPKPASGSGLLRSLSVVTAVLVLATIVAGGLVAGTEGEGTPTEPVLGAHTACGEQFPGCVDQFMPFGIDRLIDIQLVHRLFMYLTALAVLALVAVAIRQRAPSRSFVAVGGLVAAQILLGAANVWLGKHAGLIIAHLSLGTAIWATIVYANTTLMRIPAPRPVPGTVPGTGGSSRSDRDRGGDRLMESATATRDAGLVERYGAEARPTFLAHVRDYIALTKPRIISLLLVTTVATMVVAMPEGLALSTVLWTMLGGYLAAGGAGAINHYLDRDRDARMARTRSRPLVSGRIEPVHGLVFGIVLGALAFVQLALTVNMLSAVLAMAGLLGYVFVYTMWLKPLTPQNIVIGGAAGAVPPLVGWAAATGSLTLDSLYPFAIVFMWTPPHFWALSLLIKDDYARTGVPMMPVVRGEESTRRQIVVYAVLLVALTLAPVATGLFGTFYLVSALVLGGVFLVLAVKLMRSPSRQAALRLYLSSLAYLALLFTAMAIDRAI